MRSELLELWKFRELLVTMVQRELKIRYKNSVLGFMWSILNPLITVAVIWFVFGNIIRAGVQIPNYGAYILAAYLPFVFFQFSLMDSAQSILTALPIIRKIYFPREVLPLASVLANFIHFLVAIGIFFLLLLVIYIRDPRIIPFQATTIYLPVLLAINLALAAGLALIVSALNTFYEDIKYLVGVLLYLMLFLTPVMYFTEEVAYSRLNAESNGLFYTIYNLNPVAALITGYRKTLLAPQPIVIHGEERYIPLNWTHLGVAALTSVVVLIIGYHLFNRLKWSFVERP
jgi:lipopolysaccharide transport system permease protein